MKHREKVWIIHVLFQHIMSYLSFSCLKDLLQISKFWKREIIFFCEELSKKAKWQTPQTTDSSLDWLTRLMSCCRELPEKSLHFLELKSTITSHFSNHILTPSSSFTTYTGYTEWIKLYLLHFEMTYMVETKLADIVNHATMKPCENLLVCLINRKIYPIQQAIEYFFIKHGGNQLFEKIFNILFECKENLHLDIGDFFYLNVSHYWEQTWVQNWLFLKGFNPFKNQSKLFPFKHSAIEEHPTLFRQDLYNLAVKFHINYRLEIMIIEGQPKILFRWSNIFEPLHLQHYCVVHKNMGDL